jgi:hypothetical protein
VVETSGPVRATVRLEGSFGGSARWRFVARLCFFAGTGLVRLRLTLHNPRRARHRGGVWDLGDPGSVLFRDLSLEMAFAEGGPAVMAFRTEPGETLRQVPGDRLEIYQDSSGGENWRSRNHVNREGRVPCRFRGYRVRTVGGDEEGLRAEPIVCVQVGRAQLAAAVTEFWQQFPKAVEVEGGRLRIGLFPRRFDDLFELQGGEQKTHTVWLHLGVADGEKGAPLDWAHQPAAARAMPEWYAATQALPYFEPDPEAPEWPAGWLIASAVEGDHSLQDRREVIDEYGWRHFGDLYAEHEAAHYPGPPPVVSHYNNQYDVVQGALLQFLRSGDPRWLNVFGPLARHVIDIDIYHTREDRAAYNGGQFWHTDHYRDAATCTHRCYSRANVPAGRDYGGGPCNEQNYTTGLLHYYYLTGDPQARDAVRELADWVLAMDDGRRTLLGLLDDGPTGLASTTFEPSFHGPGRGCGNSVNALLDGWLVSGERNYLEKAEELIRRSVHPADDVAAVGLLRMEARWSYTVFLSVLVRYLDLKAELLEVDAAYAYARSALLHYAGWMLEHERPYFDRPEQLEYPTETWAAQELRKANVLRLAARFADEPLASALRARGNELGDRAWADLLRFPSCRVTRALAIVLGEGPRDSYLRRHTLPAAARPVGAYEFPPRAAFVPQKARVLARLKTPAGLAHALLTLARARTWWRLVALARGRRART